MTQQPYCERSRCDKRLVAILLPLHGLERTGHCRVLRAMKLWWCGHCMRSPLCTCPQGKGGTLGNDGEQRRTAGRRLRHQPEAGTPRR